MNAPSRNGDSVRPPQQGGQAGPRFGSFGMPAEKARDFGSTTRRLLRRLQRDPAGIASFTSCPWAISNGSNQVTSAPPFLRRWPMLEPMIPGRIRRRGPPRIPAARRASLDSSCSVSRYAGIRRFY